MYLRSSQNPTATVPLQTATSDTFTTFTWKLRLRWLRRIRKLRICCGRLRRWKRIREVLRVHRSQLDKKDELSLHVLSSPSTELIS